MQTDRWAKDIIVYRYQRMLRTSKCSKQVLKISVPPYYVRAV